MQFSSAPDLHAATTKICAPSKRKSTNGYLLPVTGDSDDFRRNYAEFNSRARACEPRARPDDITVET
jgi:hypothetical protein